MSDQNVDTTEPTQPTELDLLKQRCNLQGIKFHPNSKADSLKKKLADANKPIPKARTEPVHVAPLASKVVIDEDGDLSSGKDAVLARVQAQIDAKIRKVSSIDLINNEAQFVEDQLRKKATKLVRVRVTNLNTNKRDHQGEIFTTGNAVIGTVKRYVHFNAEDGWHVEQIIVDMMRERKCQIFLKGKDEKGNKIQIPKLINEFAIEVMTPLTPAEIKHLAEQQALAQNIG